MPGSEPWIGVEANGGFLFKLPASCSILELWECLSDGVKPRKRLDGQVMVRVPLDQVLTLGYVRSERRSAPRQSDC